VLESTAALQSPALPLSGGMSGSVWMQACKKWQWLFHKYDLERVFRQLEPWRLERLAASGCVWQASGRRLAGVWASGRLGVWGTSGHVWARLGTSGHVWTSGDVWNVWCVWCVTMTTSHSKVTHQSE
jgi:hypothetical protein